MSTDKNENQHYVLVQQDSYWSVFDSLEKAEKEADYLWDHKTNRERSECEIFEICECSDLDENGFPPAEWSPDEHIVRDYVAELADSEKVMDVYFAHAGKVYRLTVPDDDDPWYGIERYDDAHGTDMWDHISQDDLLGVDLGAEYPRATEVESWDDVEEEKPVTEITTTKPIAANGLGLMISVTREARMLGLDRGDVVEITMRRKN